MEYENLRLNRSELGKLGSKHNEITSLRTSGEQDEYYSTIADYTESNLSQAGTSSAQQGIDNTDSITLGDNVAANTSQPTCAPDDIIGTTNNHTLKENNNIKSSTKATIIFIVVIVVVGVASSAITFAVKDLNSSRQDNDQQNSGTKNDKHDDMLTSNPCNGSVLTLIANDTTAVLMSPGYPFSHANNLSCSWLIDSGIDGQSIAISLDYYNINCSLGDSFSVHDGTRASDSTLVNSACGRNNINQVYVSSDRYVFVMFTTDSAKQGQGFQLSYVNVPDLSLNHCAKYASTLSASNTRYLLVSPGYPFSYPNNLACSWLIDSGIDGQSIAINLDYYNMKCSFGDSFSVYDGSSTSAVKLVNSACGRNKARQMYVSSDRYVLVTFTTDSAKQGQGFQLAYVNVPEKSLNNCDMSTLPFSASFTPETLTSPGYPFTYANDLSCSWLIDSGSDGQSIAIYLEHYNMNCSFGDSFSVYDGSSTSDFALVNSVCGRNNATQLFVSSDRNVLVTFTTDSAKQGQGFQLNYVNIPDKSSYTCPVSQLSVSASETPGKLTSPGYPYITVLANYLSCTWLVDSGVDGQSIVLYAEMCKTECSYGQKFTVYDGSTTTKRRLFYKTCTSKSTGTHGPYMTTNRYALVSFETFSANQGEGLKLSYVSAHDTSATGCNSTYTLTASTNIQYLTSEGFPSYYSSNSNCSWLIRANSLSTISIDIVWSDMEQGYDFLYIYDGNSAHNSSLMPRFSEDRRDANATYTTYTSSSNNVLVVFVSDSSQGGRGFIIKYSEHITRP